MKQRSLIYRRGIDIVIRLISSLAALFGMAMLGWILSIVLLKGLPAINWEFFTELPAPPGMPGGGLANAIVGTLMITLLAGVIGVPIGLAAGVWLAEFGQQSKTAETIRFAANLLMGTPSIIIGVFIYVIMVMTTGNFSGIAGAVSLAVIMLPVVARTTEDILSLVPSALREAALALGVPRWKATLGVVFRAAKSGLLTGVLLAVARVSGETAPLLFTALNSPFWPESANEPTANLTVTIFNYAMSPYDDWQTLAWGASLLIAAGVLGTTILTRGFLWYRSK
ncbi:MAG: phosphate ABC transporter permease PstA [Deltaproteobacteria bacterium]|jgi:phosphate transport system permease protein|nr:MAG: phosphate ABC transporter permease PstA [Deltaproteobacteria bacterium]